VEVALLEYNREYNSLLELAEAVQLECSLNPEEYKSDEREPQNIEAQEAEAFLRIEAVQTSARHQDSIELSP
jgi:hypothetical protein